MQPNGSLPSFNYYGYLPEGVHDTTLEAMQERFVINPERGLLWGQFQEFLKRVVETGSFSHAYINGGFITNKPVPKDIDLILQTHATYGAEAFKAMEPSSPRGSIRFTTSTRCIFTFGVRDFLGA